MSSESLESASADIAMVPFPPDATVTHPKHDLTSLVNTLLDGPPAQATTSSESLESTTEADVNSPMVRSKKAKFSHKEDLSTDVLVEKDKEILKKNKKIKLLQQKLRRNKSSITNMKQLICQLKKKSLINLSEEEQLHNKFDGLKRSIFKNMVANSRKSSTGRRYNNTIKEFALTLSYYSLKAYAYVRSIMPLPNPSLIRKWARNVNCEPGFTGESFQILEKEAKLNEDKKDCCLVLDALAIRKQVQWESANDKYSGYVDYGLLEAPEAIASEALVFLLVG